MFYGLNNAIKSILPKRLFYRSLIIVATPIILLQIIITVVFFDSLWIKANKGMTRSLVGEVETLLDVYESEQENQQLILDLYNKNFDFVVTKQDNKSLPEVIPERWYSPIDRSLRRELKPVFGNSYWFDTVSYKELIELRIKYKNGFIQIFFPKNIFNTKWDTVQWSERFSGGKQGICFSCFFKRLLCRTSYECSYIGFILVSLRDICSNNFLRGKCLFYDAICDFRA